MRAGAVPKVPYLPPRANWVLAPPSTSPLHASRVVRPSPLEPRRERRAVAFLRPRSPGCSPSRVLLVRPAPPPSLAGVAPPISGPRLLVPPWRTRSSAGSRENKNNRRRGRGSRTRRAGTGDAGPGGAASRRGCDAPEAVRHGAAGYGLRGASPTPGLARPPPQPPAPPAWGTRRRTRPRPGPGRTAADTRAPGSRAPPPPTRWISV